MGYHGATCNQSSPCASFPCLNGSLASPVDVSYSQDGTGGQCVDEVDAFSCICSNPYYGFDCSKRETVPPQPKPVSFTTTVAVSAGVSLVLVIFVLAVYHRCCVHRLPKTSHGDHLLLNE
jgi:hypothetical protein